MPYSQVILLLLGLLQAYRLVQGFGKPSLPIRLMSFGYFLNYVVGASFSYHFNPWVPPLDVYAMQVDLDSYFEFALPFMLILVVFELQMSQLIDQIKANDEGIQMYWRTLIFVGLLAGMLQRILPSSLTFYLYLASLISPTTYILVANLRGSPFVFQRWFWIAFFWPLYSSVTTGMFYDLLLLTCLLAGKTAFSKKLSFFRSILILLVSIQIILIVQEAKHYIRQGQAITWATAKDILEDSFQFESNSVAIAAMTVRLNQGYILSHLLKTQMGASANQENGAYLVKLLASSVFPRFILPNKLNSGDRYYFEKYSGLTLIGNTSMGLGLIGESTIDFGLGTGPFILSLIFLSIFQIVKALRHRAYFSSFFLIAIFYFIRPDCDMITALGHFAKSTLIFLAILFFLGKRKSKIRPK